MWVEDVAMAKALVFPELRPLPLCEDKQVGPVPPARPVHAQ